MKLIVIDGIDGSGKSTQAEILLNKLKEKCDNVFLVSFPNYGSDGCVMVEKYLHGDFDKDPNNVNAYVSSTFYAIDRYMFFKQNKFPEDSILICNRYVLSNIIHQMSKLPEYKWFSFGTWCDNLEYMRYGIPTPVMEFYLYLKPETSMKLIEGRYEGDMKKADIHENIEFLKQSAKPIEKYIEGDGICSAIFGRRFNLIDCNSEDGIKSKEEIADMIWEKAQEVLYM